MSDKLKPDLQLEVAHVLFLDIVGYSKQVIEEQRELQHLLNQIVRNTEQFQLAEAEDKLIRLPSGDGMALVFFGSAEAPVLCALEISEALPRYPRLKLRLGINTGPVSTTTDVNDRSNVAGAGINLAERVMSIGDAGHILLSKRAAEDLLQYQRWQPHLHDLGEAEVKHGVRISLVNLYTEKLGNRQIPEKLKQLRKKEAASRRLKRWLLAGLVLFAVAVSLASLLVLRRMPGSLQNLAAMIPEKSIAVLPFESLSSDKENAYFADGVQDDILTDLAKVADLKVISRSSVMQYRAAARNLKEIGEKFRVAHVLEGSVQRSGNHIRVNAQLIDTRTDAHIWAERYDREMSDLFAVQAELTQKIVTRLKAALSPTEKAAIEKAPTQDMEAYDLYNRARALVYSFGTGTYEQDLPKAIALLETAVSRDPNFTLAYVLLTDAHVFMYRRGIDQTGERMTKAKEAADGALRSAPDSGEAHLAQAQYFYYCPRDLQPALNELNIAKPKLPNNATVFELSALVGRRLGRWKESIPAMIRAAELDPGDPAYQLGVVEVYTTTRQYKEALRAADQGITATGPKFAGPFWHRKIQIALQQGDTKAARAALDRIERKGGGVNIARGQIALFERAFPEALQSLNAAIPSGEGGPETQGWKFVQEGIIARAQHEKEKASAAFEEGGKQLEAALGKEANNAEYLSLLAVCDAGRGRKEEAVERARRAVEFQPAAKDIVNWTETSIVLAQVYAWVGERDRAIELLFDLVKKPAGPSYGILKLDPVWDDLRSDPRFDKVVAQASIPPVL